MADTQPLIAVRIKDGIFVGNVTAAHDEDFLFMNKVTHIVNCAGGEVADLFADSGIQYLTFPWRDAPGTVCTTVMFDSADRNIEQAVRFIDKGLENGDCVLVHSFFGLSRSPALVAAYFMVKYGWKVTNALSFLTMAHQEMNIKPHFERQLRIFAKRHGVDYDVYDPEVEDAKFALDNDQWMLRNTLLNGLTAEVQQRNELFVDCTKKIEIPELLYKNPAKRRRRLSFVDTRQGTGVNSSATTPVVTAKPVGGHVDPYSGESLNFHGAAGAAALKNGKLKEPIVARHGTPNTRALESPPDANAKGRQILSLKQQQQQQQQPVAPAVPPSVSPPKQQVLQQYAPPQSTVSRAVSAINTQSVEAQRRISGSAAQPQQPQQQQPQQQQQSPGAMIRSPYALTSSHAPRNGSPLPLQRAGASTTMPQQRSSLPSATSSAVRSHLPPPSSVQEIQRRASSPVVQPRTSSPMARQMIPSATSQVMANRAASPRLQPALATASNLSSLSAVQASSMRRQSSPVSRTAGSFPSSQPSAVPAAVSSLSAAASSPRPLYTTASTLQQQRATSPMSRQITQSSSALPRTSSPLQRPSSLVRTSSPRDRQQPAASNSGRSSPVRGSLADQYLGVIHTQSGPGASLPRTSTAVAPASTTVLRRQQPMAVAARRL